MTHPDNPLEELADNVRELVDSHLHTERYVTLDARNRPLPAKQHITRHPSLLNQLRAAASAGRDGGDGQMAGGYESKPAARLEAIGQMLRIQAAVDDWLVRHLNAEPRPTIEQQVRQLVGLLPTLSKADQHRLAADVHRWRIWARVVTGWDSPPWQPNVPCPNCEHRGELRIRMLDRTAACLNDGCDAVWDASTFGLLADQIANHDADVVNAERQRAELAATLADYFPRRGPCLCGRPEPHDARHRLVDAIVSEFLAGVDAETIAVAYDLDVRAVQVAFQATRTFADLEPYPRRTQQRTAS